jgi:hypothetical protein
MALEVPIGGIHGLPDTVEVRLAADPGGASAVLSQGVMPEQGKTKAQGEYGWKSVVHPNYYT